MKVDEPSVIVEQQFKFPIETIWNAITNINEMRQWFFENIPEFEAKVGFHTQFSVATDHHIFPHLWKIIEVIPHQKIVYNWKYKGYEGDSNVTFQLSQIKNRTLLIVKTEVMEDFPDDISEFKRESCLAGWNYFIKERLVKYLDN